MPKQIIVRYTGPFAQSPFQLNAGGDSVQIAIRELGEESDEVIFTSNNFSPQEYEKSGGAQQEKEHFNHFSA